MTNREAIDVAYEVMGLTELAIAGIVPWIEISGVLDRLLAVSSKVRNAVEDRATPEVLENLGLTLTPPTAISQCDSEQ